MFLQGEGGREEGRKEDCITSAALKRFALLAYSSGLSDMYLKRNQLGTRVGRALTLFS